MVEPTAAEFEALKNAVAELVRWSKTVKRTLNDAGQAQEQAKNRLRDLDTRLAALKKATDEFKTSAEQQRKADRARIDSVEKDVRSATDSVGRLREECDLLGRRIRLIQSPERKAMIDTWAAGHADLGRAVAEGREAARQQDNLPTPATLRARIDQYDKKIAAHRNHQSKAIEAARQMVKLSPAAPREEWAEPLRAWASNRDSATELARQLPKFEAEARRARAELETLSGRSTQLRPTADRGRHAEVELRQKIRAYLEKVVDDDLVLPMWLDRALGPGLPKDAWRQWMATAIDVVFYRIVYQVPSLVDALGDRPDAEGEQQAEYDRLKLACEDYRM